MHSHSVTAGPSGSLEDEVEEEELLALVPDLAPLDRDPVKVERRRSVFIVLGGTPMLETRIGARLMWEPDLLDPDEAYDLFSLISVMERGFGNPILSDSSDVLPPERLEAGPSSEDSVTMTSDLLLDALDREAVPSDLET